MIGNRLFCKLAILLSLILSSSCSKDNDDPLILPPNYSKLPSPDQDGLEETLTDNKDLKPLKDILLQ